MSTAGVRDVVLRTLDPRWTDWMVKEATAPEHHEMWFTVTHAATRRIETFGPVDVLAFLGHERPARQVALAALVIEANCFLTTLERRSPAHDPA